MDNKLEQILQEKGAALIDGAMGTELFARGLTTGDPPEQWNVEHPDRVADVHSTYIEAGSDIILTNTFGGTSFRLKLHKLEALTFEYNRAGAEVARKAADESDRTVLVAGSMGPTGEIFEPMGSMKYDDAVAAFAVQARGLAEGGVDLFWIETMSDTQEVKAAVEGIRSVNQSIPICATMTFDTKGRTMMGVTPQDAVKQLSEWGVYGIGANCGNGPDEIETVIEAMHEAMPDAVLIAKSNAGIPQWINNVLSYDGTPEVMSDYVVRVRALGAKILGGCCGASSMHVRAMADALAQPIDENMVVTARGYQVKPVASDQTDSGGRRRRRRR